MTSKQKEQRKKKAARLVKELSKLFPNPKIALNYSTNWELLVAVILSAQCTDKRVNEVTKKLFKKYKKLDDYVKVSPKEFEKDIYSTGFYRSKTKNILAAAKVIKEKYGGRVPKTMEEMLTIPGAARKTANVVLSTAYGIVEGVTVDTHVIRLARRFGLTEEKTAEKIEKDLMEILPKKEWKNFSHRIIFYGREYCPARTCLVDHPLNAFDK